MQKYSRFPFLFFFLAACVGLLLRWYFISSISWLKFPYWLHAHSHLMFLGWVFNLLSLAFIDKHIEEHRREKYKNLFLIIQVLLLGMLISFPLQGYGLYSISLSTFHTIVVGVFTFWFFKDTKHYGFDPARWFARLSLIFFLISSLGPFSLGPLMANGLAQSKWYYFAVYYYLHFQYNGVFTFGAVSLFLSLLNERGVLVDQLLVKRFGYLMLISCVLGYSLSTLWASPGLIFNVLGFIAALIQLVAFIYFIKILRSIPATWIKSISPSARILFRVALLSFVTKLILQLVSAHPYMAQLAYEVRNYVMAYLHLVLLGMISCFLLAWSMEKEWILKAGLAGALSFVVGFIGMEITLISGNSFMGSLVNSALLLFIFSLMIVVGLVEFLISSFRVQSKI